MPKDKKTLAFVIRRTYRIVVDSSHRDVAQPGSAFAWGASGRWFESSHPDWSMIRGVKLLGLTPFLSCLPALGISWRMWLKPEESSIIQVYI